MANNFNECLSQLNKTYDLISNVINKNEQKIDIYPNELELLKQPQKSIEVSVPIKLDNGKVKVYQGYRVQYNNYLGMKVTASEGKLDRDIAFEVKHFFRLLKVNKNAERIQLKINSELGLAHVHAKDKNIESNYYILETDGFEIKQGIEIEEHTIDDSDVTDFLVTENEFFE